MRDGVVVRQAFRKPYRDVVGRDSVELTRRFTKSAHSERLDMANRRRRA